MAYVKRDPQGAIVGVFRRPQQDATEKVADTDPGVVAFVSSMQKTPADRVEARINGDDRWRALIGFLSEELGKTPQQILTAMRSKV